MQINYPNGTTHFNNETNRSKKQASRLAPPKNFGKRGMTFEEHINTSNEFYAQRKIAVIHKKPTPIQIVKVDYPSRSAATITEAYFRQASTTDYNGVFQGYYLDFEAKETKNKQSFPLNNFHAHQLEHLQACHEQHGISFVLLWFSSLQRCFFLPLPALQLYWQDQANGKKSIPLKDIEKKGIEITLGVHPRIPYIEAVKEYITKGMKN